MLQLSLSFNDVIQIADDTTIINLGIKGKHIRIGIGTPDHFEPASRRYLRADLG